MSVLQIRRISPEDTISIRHQVLWPHKSIEFCMVADDENAQHWGAYKQNTLACVASIYITKRTARLRKFATLPEFQHQGIGSQMLAHIIDSIQKQGIQYWWLDARESAIDFYRRFNLTIEGDIFYKEEIAYYRMGRHFSRSAKEE